MEVLPYLVQPNRNRDSGKPETENHLNQEQKKENSMNRKNSQNYQMLTRVVDFATANVTSFPKHSAAADILQILKTGLRALSQADSARKIAEADLRGARIAKALAREDLHDVLGRAALVARALHNSKVPVFSKGTDQELIDLGPDFAREAESSKADFIRHGLPPEEIQTAVDALIAARKKYAAARAGRMAANREWQAALTPALDALVGLDALIANTLADNPSVLASYEFARTIPRIRSKPSAAPAPVAAVPLTTAAVPPLSQAPAA